MMKQLSTEKKKHLLLVALATGGALAAIWFGIVKWQKGNIRRLVSEGTDAKTKVEQMTREIKNAPKVQERLTEVAAKLKQQEELMASGDLYAWIINAVRDFKASYDVEIPQFSTIVVEDTQLIPSFPYKQARMTVGGLAYYHDIGQFIAGFENRFPIMRIENLQLEPSPSAIETNKEKLAFKLDIVALVAPNA